MLNKYLNDIAKIKSRFNQKLQPPATAQAVENLKKAVKDKFKADLPEQYINFLRTVDGLSFNGLVIYGVDPSLSKRNPADAVYGFTETNEVWHKNESQKKYLFFGDADMDWYCLNLSTGAFEERDKPSGTMTKTFEDFNSMVESALEPLLEDE